MKSRGPQLTYLAALLLHAANGNAQLFSPAGNVAVGRNPVAIAVGDFNADGYPDFAVANRSSNNVTVRLGGFSSSSATFAVGASPAAIAVGDFNWDGLQDLVVANSGDNNLTILLGGANGVFAAAPGGPVAAHDDDSECDESNPKEAACGWSPRRYGQRSHRNPLSASVSKGCLSRRSWIGPCF